ncbi:unnamed protein product [Amoebophrya sp. A25]|nr:unnamed protein product [Amoebophrya sp. A25]|eukprot:GSA25T00002145001.1
MEKVRGLRLLAWCGVLVSGLGVRKVSVIPEGLGNPRDPAKKVAVLEDSSSTSHIQKYDLPYSSSKAPAKAGSVASAQNERLQRGPAGRGRGVLLPKSVSWPGGAELRVGRFRIRPLLSDDMNPFLSEEDDTVDAFVGRRRARAFSSPGPLVETPTEEAMPDLFGMPLQLSAASCSSAAGIICASAVAEKAGNDSSSERGHSSEHSRAFHTASGLCSHPSYAGNGTPLGSTRGPSFANNGSSSEHANYTEAGDRLLSPTPASSAVASPYPSAILLKVADTRDGPLQFREPQEAQPLKSKTAARTSCGKQDVFLLREAKRTIWNKQGGKGCSRYDSPVPEGTREEEHDEFFARVELAVELTSRLRSLLQKQEGLCAIAGDDFWSLDSWKREIPALGNSCTRVWLPHNGHLSLLLQDYIRDVRLRENKIKTTTNRKKPFFSHAESLCEDRASGAEDGATDIANLDARDLDVAIKVGIDGLRVYLRHREKDTWLSGAILHVSSQTGRLACSSSEGGGSCEPFAFQ